MLDIIAIVVSVFAFLLSALQWAFSIYQRRVRLDFKVVDYDAGDNYCVFFVSVMNKTDNACSITSIQMLKDEWITCELLPVYSNRIKGHVFHSAHFPVNLSPRGGQSFHIYFSGIQDASLEQGHTVDFQIHTNHRTIQRNEILRAKRHYCTHRIWFARSDR